jgi:hypothetical protein
MRRNRFPLNLTRLVEDRAASTLVRLIYSRHVADLQLIFLIILVLFVVGGPILVRWHVNSGQLQTTDLISSPALVAALVGIGATALARLYQMGSSRLGVVDLFACEMSTICRVVAVTDTTSNLVQLYHNPPSQPQRFFSEEKYSPIFDLNARELQMLEARVVERVTEFYTYLKAARDYLRGLGQVEVPTADTPKWQASVRSTIYMMFLMLESARSSVDRLVEYEPEWAQYTTEILFSEIVAYGFLLRVFRQEAQEDPGHNAWVGRLDLRRRNYVHVITELGETTKKLKGPREEGYTAIGTSQRSLK